MSDLTVKLRHLAAGMMTTLTHGAVMRQAADELDRLERELARAHEYAGIQADRESGLRRELAEIRAKSSSNFAPESPSRDTDAMEAAWKKAHRLGQWVGEYTHDAQMNFELGWRMALERPSQGTAIMCGWYCPECNSSGEGALAVRGGVTVCPLCLSKHAGEPHQQDTER